MEFYRQEKEEVLHEFKVNGETGLTAREVESRRQVSGWNELKEKKQLHPVLIFLRQFKSFIIYILLFAVLVSLLSGEKADALVILFILALNAVIGFLQEYKAEKSIASLKKLSALKAKVLRQGEMVLIDSKELVPGDILFLEEGSKIPADARILEAYALAVSESSLTGESIPVSKHEKAIEQEEVISDQRNMLFSGTLIARGRAKAVVVATGMKGEIGKIAGMISEVQEEQTPLQKKLESFGRKIGAGTLLICLVIFLVGIIKDRILHLLFAGEFVAFLVAAKTWLLTAVSLAVAAVPEGLPAIVTIVLSLGVIKMARKNALIRRLPSVETLGETTIICADKTGTLTTGKMHVQAAYFNRHDLLLDKIPKNLEEEGKLLFLMGVLCNDASLNEPGEFIGDPTEAALLVSAKKAGIEYGEMRKLWLRKSEEPFDAVRKMMSTLHIDPKTEKEYVFTKGSPENLLEKCTRILIQGRIVRITSSLREEILRKNTEYARRALRVLGFAYKDYRKGEFEEDLVFVGLQGMIDPPRPEVKDSVMRCKGAGIKVMMITGDNKNTAEAIAREIGIEGEAMNGLDFAKLSREEQLQALESVSVFSRVEPRHKMIIVELLKSKGEVVAMTGDGVNDSPAIKKADIGIAMGITGTDVTKETSDMILIDDNFTSIVNAVEEGRGLYENIRKFVNYLLSCNLGEILVIFTTILLGLPLPLTAIMLLWLNLVTDGLPAVALSVDPYPRGLMQRPPRKVHEGIINREMLSSIFVVSFFVTAGVLSLFFWGIYFYKDSPLFLGKIQTLAFTALVVMEMARLQAIRSEQKLRLFSNKYLVAAILSSLALQLLVIYTPLHTFFNTVALSALDWALLLGVSSIIFLLSRITLKFLKKK